MRRVYTPPPPRSDLLFALAGALLLTLAVFLVLPLTQMVSSSLRQRELLVRPVDFTELQPEEEREEPPPPPPVEEEPPEPPPTLAESPVPMNLSVDLEVALGSGGAMAMASGFLAAGTAAAAGAEAFSLAELERRPELLSARDPVYPPALRQARVEGAVVLVFLLDETGRVLDPRVESGSHREFETAALEAIRRWRFRPGMKDGEPVRTHVRQTIRFALPGSS